MGIGPRDKEQSQTPYGAGRVFHSQARKHPNIPHTGLKSQLMPLGLEKLKYTQKAEALYPFSW